ncbi:TPA: hypothetical protein I8571_000252 [Citrobacter freundii]|uniref:hypothetical protein n=1 Tax=Citrobacter braakii TaxID=57706 RepID=UPI001A269461|nr:hypothetical protein [Citrobacter freundii]HEF0122927.1 hypothetical protein [Citrobacter youngae]
MNNELQKNKKLVEVLLKNTLNGTIKWKPKKAPTILRQGTEDIFHQYFEGRFKNNTIAIYERRFQYYNDMTDSFLWGNEYCLSLVKYQLTSLEIDSGIVNMAPIDTSDTIINTLFLAVTQKSMSSDDIIDQLLEDED